MILRLYKEVRVTGTVYEDGADTRDMKISYILVPENQQDKYQENCADESGHQDYGYAFSSKCILEGYETELLKIKDALINLESDIEKANLKDCFTEEQEKQFWNGLEVYRTTDWKHEGLGALFG